MSYLFDIAQAYIKQQTEQQQTKAAQRDSSPAVTVPIVNQPVAPNSAGLTEVGNVPLATPSSDSDMGTKVESQPKNEQTTEAQTATNPEKPQSQADEKQVVQKSSARIIKDGKNLDSVIDRFYDGKYRNATEEEKEKMIADFFTWVAENNSKGKFTQLDQMKLYRDRCKSDSPEEYRRLSSIIDKMEDEYQAEAAVTMSTKGDEMQKQIARRAIAADRHNYTASAQLAADEIIVQSKDVVAIKEMTRHISQLDEKNHAAAVRIEQKAQISDNDKKEIDKVIIDQYGAFAENQQVEIHDIMAHSKFEETQVYAAENIYNFAEQNQKAAVDITISTGVDAAIQAAAANFEKYAESLKPSLKTSFQSLNNEAVNASIKAAEAKSATINQQSSAAKAESVSVKPSSTSDIKSLSKAVAEMSSGINSQENIIKFMEDLSDTQRKQVFSTLPSAVQVQIFKASPELFAGSEYSELIQKLVKNMGRDDIDKVAQKYVQSGGNLLFAGEQVQISYIKNNPTDMGRINYDFLGKSAKELYKQKGVMG